MSDIPADIMRTARTLADDATYLGYTHAALDIARAILAERERWQNQDDPATTVYGRLLWHHMSAARKDFNGSERAKLYELIEAFSALFPSECAVWDARFSPERAGE